MTETTQVETSPEDSVEEASSPHIWRRHLFFSLRYRDFRLLWIGQTLQSEGQWMEQIARGFLLWELSHDPFLHAHRCLVNNGWRRA